MAKLNTKKWKNYWFTKKWMVIRTTGMSAKLGHIKRLIDIIFNQKNYLSYRVKIYVAEISVKVPL